MGSNRVLSDIRHRWTRLIVTPARQAGTRFYITRSEGWKAELTLVLVIYTDCLPACRQSPIQVLTTWQRSDRESNPRHHDHKSNESNQYTAMPLYPIQNPTECRGTAVRKSSRTGVDILCRYLPRASSPNSDLISFKLKIATPVAPSLAAVQLKFCVLFFVFLSSSMESARDGRARSVMRPINTAA